MCGRLSFRVLNEASSCLFPKVEAVLSLMSGNSAFCAVVRRSKTPLDRCGSRNIVLATRNKASCALLRERNKRVGKSLAIVQLLRHGAHSDVGHRLTGRGTDHGLTHDGRRQAETAAAQLERSRPHAIYSSPRRRTRETAAIVADRLGLDVIEAPALDEVDFGEWTGRSFAELDRDPRWLRWNAERSRARCPGGESQGEAQARALAFAFEASARHRGPVLLVTHCDIVRALSCWAERRSLDEIHTLSCEPGSLTRIDLLADARAAA